MLWLDVTVGPGSVIGGSIATAHALAKAAPGLVVRFQFNGQTVIVDAESDCEKVRADYLRRVHEARVDVNP